ncbi:hypothetical protein KUTeg_014742 [Tegillarca granosa]|uniref:C-type lectin domain-containing protein n=1 Tax=Tegillarca granosa TaxID=220873 RepID=A0ABQ9EUT9_TEGGR|nr:hypothetical protein KUTeg_014742 [Tegillarca granosa]
MLPKVSSTRIKQRLTLFTNAKTWNEAKAVCESDGMRLLQIESQSKSITVDKNGDLWIGLHEVDESQPQIVQWTDCNATQYQDFASPPSAIPDNNFCYTLTSVGLNWKPIGCDTVLQFICEKDISLCDFDVSKPATGCSWSDKESANVAIAPCHGLCLDGVWADAKECWAIGFWDGYSGDDCWMFFSYDPDACVNNEYSSNPIVLYYKTCYINPTTTVAMETTRQDTSTTFIAETTSQDTSSTTTLHDTTLKRDTTTVGHETTSNSETTSQTISSTTTDTRTTMEGQATISIAETSPKDTSSITTFKDTSVQGDTSTTTVTTIEHDTTSVAETTSQDISSETTSQGISSTTSDTSIQVDTSTTTIRQETTVTTTSVETISTSVDKFTDETSSVGQVTSSSAQLETSSLISDSTILLPSSTSTTGFNNTECLCGTKQSLTMDELQALLNDLSIDKKQTSIHKRRFYSPTDERTSAKSIGYAGGIFLAISFGGIFLLDVQVLFKHFKLRFNQTRIQRRRNGNKNKRESVVKFDISGNEAC